MSHNSSMMGGRMGVWALGLAILCVGYASADISPRPNPDPPPPRPRTVTANVRVLQTQGNTYRIVIPASVLKSPHLQLGQWEAPIEAEEAGNRQRTLFAGLALSAAACSLVLVRKRSYGVKVLVAVVFAGIAYAGAEWAYADLAPFRPRGPVNRTAKIEIQVTNQGRDLQLFLPANRRAPVERPQGGFGSGFGGDVEKTAPATEAPPAAPESRPAPPAPK